MSALIRFGLGFCVVQRTGVVKCAGAAGHGGLCNRIRTPAWQTDCPAGSRAEGCADLGGRAVKTAAIGKLSPYWPRHNQTESLDCTPELIHAGRRLIRGHLGRFGLFYISLSSRRAAGVWNIPKGFPRPVGAVVNRSLVFHRFHQCRHFREPSWPARILPVLDIVTRNAICAGCTPAPETHRCGCARLLYRDSQPRIPPPV